MTEAVDIEVATFEATCQKCQAWFASPRLSDFAYGEFIFSSEDGQDYAYCNAFEPAAKLIEVLLPENCGAVIFQSALAELADPILGRKFKTSIRCPKCHSTAIGVADRKTGKRWVKSVTYKNLLQLERNALIRKVSSFAGILRA